ncbi:hypothetical protein ABT340_26190 [Streptosporangium sp. NPDC000239]|uniref:hypothetical protein n=1 Tax=Streptosporangium sp. NPDC000239 TaxID=3154248 RepID=UPI0033309081
MLLGYATAARSSELAALNIGDVAETAEGLVVTVYRRKIKKYIETAVPYGSNPATCPVRATRTLVTALAEHDRTTGPLLVRIDRHDGWADAPAPCWGIWKMPINGPTIRWWGCR